jgi:hypothetical protein
VLGYPPSLLLLALLLHLMLPLTPLPAADQHQAHQLASHCLNLVPHQHPQLTRMAMHVPALLHS